MEAGAVNSANVSAPQATLEHVLALACNVSTPTACVARVRGQLGSGALTPTKHGPVCGTSWRIEGEAGASADVLLLTEVPFERISVANLELGYALLGLFFRWLWFVFVIIFFF